MNAQQLISQSIANNATIHADWSEELETALLAECEDSADSKDVVEFWGTTDSGSEWRVHLDGERPCYIVVPAPGHYGDRARVLSAHIDLDAARDGAMSGYVVRECASKRRGDEWLRVDEQHYPIAQ